MCVCYKHCTMGPHTLAQRHSRTVSNEVDDEKKKRSFLIIQSTPNVQRSIHNANIIRLFRVYCLLFSMN